ncbi:MAG: glutamate cyclase domain-containing protein [Acidimicrobiia bacterium]
MSVVIGEYIDRLATIEMRPGKGNLPRGVIHLLYDAAREKFGRPLSLGIAEALVERVGKDDTVFILTGAGGPPVLPKAEVDGIPGAVAIARAIHFGIGARVAILTEERAKDPVRAAVWGAGLNFREMNDPEVDNCVLYIPTEIGHDESKTQAADLLDRLSPSAVIGIEKLSPNDKGVIHGATGLNYDDVHSKPQYIFEMAQDRGILTCGIGDGGNEVGYGVIIDTVKEVMPAGAVCECDCRGGSAASVKTDQFMVAAISDWGGYAVAAMLAALTNSHEMLLTDDDVERILLATVNAGAFDGATARPTLSDDGVDLDAQRAYVTMLRRLVLIFKSDLASPGH